MKVQVPIDAYFKTKSSASPAGINKKHKVMKRHNLSLIKSSTPQKTSKKDDDLNIMEKIVTTIDLSSDDESSAINAEPTSNSEAPISNVGTSSSSMTTNQHNLTPKTPIKYLQSITDSVEIVKSENNITVINQHSDEDKTLSTETKPSSIRHEVNSYLSQPQSIDKPSTSSMTPILNNLTPKDEDVSCNLSQSCLSDAGSSNSSTSTILYSLTPQTPEKTQKMHKFITPSSSTTLNYYYSPNKKRSVAKRSPVKRSLAHDFASTSKDDEVFNNAWEGTDHKTKFLLSIINKFINDDALKKLLNEESNVLLNSILHLKQPGARVVCRMYWRQTQWYRVEQIKQLCVEKKDEIIDDPNIFKMLNTLIENKLITSSNDNDSMTFEDYAKVLKGDEIKQICKDLKIKCKTKQDAIQELRKYCRSKPIVGIMNGSPSNNTQRVLDIMKTKAGSSYKLSEATRVTVYKLYLLMYLGINYEVIRSKKLELMLNNEKNDIETYPVDKNMVLDNATVLFNDSIEFCKYYDAHMLYENYLSEQNTQNKCSLINNVFKLYHGISEEDMLRYKSFPIWLHRFTPAYLYVKILDSGVQELKKDKQNEMALDVVTFLISQFAFRQHKKAGWYAEKALILHKLFGDHNGAAKVLIEGLKSNLSFEAKDAMRKRADLIANQKNIELEENLKKELKEYASKELIMENKFKADHINQQHIESNNQRGKKIFKVETIDEIKYVEAEDYCVIYYTTEGPWTHAEHREGRIITTIFFLLFWDIIYSKPRGVTGIFLSQYQEYPLDMYYESFYTNRKTLIDERLAQIEDMTTVDMVEVMRCKWEERPERELSGINRNIGWENISMVSTCLGSRHTAALCRRLATNYGYTHSGFPDLTLWNTYTREIKFVEVKTDTDKPSIKQLQWMEYLTENGIDTGFCYLGVNTTRCKARARDTRDNCDTKRTS